MNSEITSLTGNSITRNTFSTTPKAQTTSDPHNIKESQEKTRRILDSTISTKDSKLPHKKLADQKIHHIKPSQDRDDTIDTSPKKHPINDDPNFPAHTNEKVIKICKKDSCNFKAIATNRKKCEPAHEYTIGKNEISLTNQKNMSHNYLCLKRAKSDPELSLYYDAYGYLYCYRCEKINNDAENQKLFASLYMQINTSCFFKNSLFPIQEGNGEYVVSLEDIDALNIHLLPEKDELVRQIRSEVRKMMHCSLQKNRNYVDESLENQKSLCHIYQCLNRVKSNPQLSLHLDSFGCLSCDPIKEPIDNTQKQKILIHLFMTVSNAICLKNMTFYSCKEAIANPKNLDEIVKLETLMNMINEQHLFKNELIEVVQTNVLKLLKMSYEPKQDVCIKPRKEIKLLEESNLSIKAIKSVEHSHHQNHEAKLNERAKTEMELMSTIQERNNEFNVFVESVQKYVNEYENKLHYKIESLSNYKSQLEDYLIFLEFHRSWTSNKFITGKVIKLCEIDKTRLNIIIQNNTNPILIKLVEEIEFLSLGVKFLPIKIIEKSIDVEKFLLTTAFSEISIPTIQENFMQIIHEMKFYAGHTFCLLTWDILNAYKNFSTPLDPAHYSILLKSFVFKNFNHVISKYSKGKKRYHHEQKDAFAKDFFNLYALFTKMAYELIHINDYHSAYPISFALRDSSVKWITQKNQMPDEIQKMHDFVFKTLDLSFNHLSKKFDELRLNKIYHVPYAAFIHQYIEQKVGSLEGKEKALEIKNLNDYLKYQRFIFNTAAENLSLHTDIFEQIYSSQNIVLQTPDLKLTLK